MREIAKNMNKIPFLNLPSELGWNSKYNIILDYYKNTGCLKTIKNIRRPIICIEATYQGIEFEAWLNFSRLFKKLKSVDLAIPKDVYKELRYVEPFSVIKNFLLTYGILYESLGEPNIKKGISINGIKEVKDINSVDVNNLPYFEWSLDSSRLVHKLIDHGGIGPNTKLEPK